MCTQLRKYAAGDIVPSLTILEKQEILCFDSPKTRSNQYIKSRKVATFKNCEIFPNLYFPYVRHYKATLSGGNKLDSTPLESS